MKARYVELLFTSTDCRDLPAHSLAGYVIVSDYHGDQGRHLFLKRNDPAAAAPPSASKPARKKRAAKTKPASTLATDIAVEVAHG